MKEARQQLLKNIKLSFNKKNYYSWEFFNLLLFHIHILVYCINAS